MTKTGHVDPGEDPNEVGDAYFVVDGNHRVSVARFHGVRWIDADVTEFRAAIPAGRATHEGANG